MPATFSEPAAWACLLDWYVSASETIGDLEVCRVIVHSMLAGTATTNAVVAEALDALTRRSELWLATHPSPDAWNGEHLGAAVHVYMRFGRAMKECGWDPANADATELRSAVSAGDLLMDEVDGLVGQLSRLLEV